MKSLFFGAVAVLFSLSVQAEQCHELAGTWVDEAIMNEVDSGASCPVIVENVTVRSADGSEVVRDVVKFDRYVVGCNGNVEVAFAETLGGPKALLLFDISEFEVQGSSANKRLVAKKTTAKHKLVSDAKVSEILAEANECLSK